MLTTTQSLQEAFEAVGKASRTIPLLEVTTINQVLLDVANEAEQETDFLLAENQKDLDRMDESDPKFDRLKLTPQRIKAIADDIRNVSRLNYPVGKILSSKLLPNGLELTKITVPLGVIGIVYEARPNVTFDVFALCLKSGNACILKGGSDASYSNEAIISVIKRILTRYGIDENIVHLLPPDRSATDALLKAVGYVDVIIPRGSQSLIDFVRANSRVPVIETGAGIVHVYFDENGDLTKAVNIVHNSKTRRVSVCNALDCLLIHQNRLPDLVALVTPLGEDGVELFADDQAFDQLQGYYPYGLLHRASPEHFGTEFLSMKMAIRTVRTLEEALDHIATYSSKHSEAIVTEDMPTAEKFTKAVDAAAVYINAATSFTDGAQFGLGAEIGISTQKLHARGPMALEELTSYKWIVRGNGQIRAK
ncbi:glutamate-5-semialdehyde dehydrogenase [Cytophagaceae bacterium YF14B1]|uniref:Gamma-glutamyl phosphate reductase n=1 Tax=Xanthocytophaga flava TaxID=3048013 RepID=A0AAE3U542_9BACT|nr:glutamate-5-semialdehyde dehydrogenase [Xanthocytophaga flavus]MDJ1479896.1 glutamate-5-semialdehyde dehydrogenase [Xanthocytophaga flavus]